MFRLIKKGSDGYGGHEMLDSLPRQSIASGWRITGARLLLRRESQGNAFECDESHSGLVGIFERRGVRRGANLCVGDRIGERA